MPINYSLKYNEKVRSIDALINHTPIINTVKYLSSILRHSHGLK